MKIIKDRKTSLLLKSFLLNNQDYLSVSVLYYFDLNNPDAPLDEQAMYKESATQLGKTILDYAMAKPKAEVLVCGSCHNPQPSEGASHVKLQVGSMEKQLFVFGEREWKMGTITKALPFKSIPLDYAHAIPIDENYLPHVENPDTLTVNKGIPKAPAGFMPLDMFRDENMKKLGTYNEDWKRELWPGFAQDMDYSFFNTAPKDQQFENFFEGGESIKLINMHPEHQVINSNIPQTFMRCFATKSHEAKDDEFVEVKLQRDTLWLFPEIQRGIVIFRGTIAVKDEIYSNLRYLNLKQTAPDEHAKSLDEYYALQKKELNKSVELDETSSEAADAKIKEVNKELFDIPRNIKENIQKAQGKRPSLQRTSAETVEQSHARIDKAIARIDKSKLKLQKMKEKYGHISKIDTTSLDDARERLLASKVQISNMMADMDKVVADGEAIKAETLSKIEKVKINPNIPDETKQKIDTSFLKPKVKVWSDYAFEFLSETVKRLEKSPEELHKLRHLGLLKRTISRAWIGFNTEDKIMKAEEWKLDSEKDIELPKGFVTARFEEATLKSLRIENNLVLGADENFELFLSEENYDFPLFYLKNDLEAHLCDQEAFDICNSLVCDDISSVGNGAKEALEKASVIFYLKEDGVIDKLPQAKKFDCGEYENLFQLHQNGVEIREQIVQNLPKDVLDTLPVKRDVTAKSINKKTKEFTDKVKVELKAEGEALKKELEQERDDAIAKTNKLLAKQGLDPIKLEPHQQSDSLIEPSKIADIFDKAIAILKREERVMGINLEDTIAKLQKAKEKSVAFAQKAEKMYIHGMKKIAETEEKAKDPIPPWAKKMMLKAGIDPSNPHPAELTREMVIDMHAEGKSFARKNLSELDLSELDLNGIDLTQANCTKTDFSKTNLSGAKISQAIFKESIFDKAILNDVVANKAFFNASEIKNAKMKDTVLDGAVFKETDIQNASFEHCDLSNVNFLNTSIKGSSFNDSTMDKVLFSKSSMSSCELINIDSKKMLFNKSKATECNFSQSKLYNMRILKSSSFERCDLSKCNMDKTTIFEASLDECNLQRSTLNKALIKKSEISESDFRGVVAKQGRFEYSKFTNNLFNGINLFKGSLRRMDMKRCDFSHSNLYAVEMYKTKLFEVKLDGANLKRSNLEDRVELIGKSDD